jgi:hypothetical protein
MFVQQHTCRSAHDGEPKCGHAEWIQAPWDYYAFRNGSRTRVLADIPPFGLALDGAWIAHYYTKVSQHAHPARVPYVTA